MRASPADAGYTKLSGAACTWNVAAGTPSPTGSTLRNDSTSGTLSTYCPVWSSERLHHYNVANNSGGELDVYVYDGNDAASITAYACIQYFDGTGGACGSAASSSYFGTGWDTLSPSLSVWGNISNFSDVPYVSVNLPVKDGSSTSYVAGLYMDDY